MSREFVQSYSDQTPQHRRRLQLDGRGDQLSGNLGSGCRCLYRGAWYRLSRRRRDGTKSEGLWPKLEDYWHYEGRGYQKALGSCNEPFGIPRPLPRHDLRNGNLNQTAHGLYLFIPITGGDLVGWMDRRLAMAAERTISTNDEIVYPMAGHYRLNKVLATETNAATPAIPKRQIAHEL